MELKSHDRVVHDFEKLPIRQKMILTTLELIEKSGIHGLTTRSIAETAEVNVAAVNYYFGSKQKLIEECLEFALKHMFSDTEDIHTKENSEPESFMKNIMLYFLEGSLRYPGLIKAMLHEPINNNNYQEKTMQQILMFISELISKIEQSPSIEQNAAKINVLQILSASLMPALLPDLFQNILDEDFPNNPDLQKQYIRQFFEK